MDDKISGILCAFALQTGLPRHLPRQPMLYRKTNFCIPLQLRLHASSTFMILFFWVHSADNLFSADRGPNPPTPVRSSLGVVCHVQWAEVLLDSFMDFIVKNCSLMEVGGYFRQMLRAVQHLSCLHVLPLVNDGC